MKPKKKKQQKTKNKTKKTKTKKPKENNTKEQTASIDETTSVFSDDASISTIIQSILEI
jgi:hypothetical protein